MMKAASICCKIIATWSVKPILRENPIPAVGFMPTVYTRTLLKFVQFTESSDLLSLCEMKGEIKEVERSDQNELLR